MTNEQQLQLLSFTQQFLSQEPDSKEAETLQSVIGMVYTLLTDGKLDELDKVLRVHFPQYYTSPMPFLISEN